MCYIKMLLKECAEKIVENAPLCEALCTEKCEMHRLVAVAKEVVDNA